MRPSRENEFEQTIVQEFRANNNYISKRGANLERDDTHEVILKNRLKPQLQKLNPNASDDAIEKAIDKITSYESQNRRRENNHKYKQITQGISVEDETGEQATVSLFDFDEPDNNEFLVVNQFTVKYRDNDPKTPDLVIFINGIPVGVFELKTIENTDENLVDAYNQITDRYYQDIPHLFYYNQFIAVANENEAKVGSHTAPWEWMTPWRYIEQEPEKKGEYKYKQEYNSLIQGLFDKHRMLDVIKNYVLFEDNTEPNKITPAYYQYYGIEKAIESSTDKLGKTAENNQQRKIGTVSHSQGSGKSISITFYINKLAKLHPNALFITVTDTNDLDEQLHNESLDNYGLNPQNAETIDDLRESIKSYSTGGSGIITTTIQKFQLKESTRAKEAVNKSKKYFNHTQFSNAHIRTKVRESIIRAESLISETEYAEAIELLDEQVLPIVNQEGEQVVQSEFDYQEEYVNVKNHPVLNERSDIIIISDEAHRSQDKSLGRNLRMALPNAAQIGFTATPIYNDGANETAEWFGDEISSYMMDQAVNDGSVVQIDYENRAPKLEVDVEELQKAYDEERDEETAFERVSFEDVLKTEERQRKIAKDIVEHFNERQIQGKAMLVAPDREAAVKYSQYIQQLQQESDIDNVPESHPIISSPGDFDISYAEDMETRFKAPEDSFNLAIVCDKWTTGFNVKHLHTMYIDKPLRGHNLVQTLGRVNRTHIDKDSGLVIDYIGLSESKDKAFDQYTTGNNETEQVQTDFDQLEDEFEEAFMELKSLVRIPEDIENWNIKQEKEQLIHEGMDEVENNGNTQEFLENFRALKSAYKRIHPCEFTESRYYEIMYLIRIGSRLSVLEDENASPPRQQDLKGINELIDESVRAEEAVQIEMVEEGTIEENISTPGIDIPRVSEGIKEKLQKQSTYSLRTYEEVKDDVESVVESYNNGRIDEDKAVHNLKRALERVKREEGRAEEFGLTGKQLSLFDIITEETELDESYASDAAKEIDELLKSKLTTDWHTRSDTKDGLVLDVYQILSSEYDINDMEAAERMIEFAENIY